MKAWQSSWQQEYMGRAPQIIADHQAAWSEVGTAYNLQGPSLVTCSYQGGSTFHQIMLPAREEACKPWASLWGTFLFKPWHRLSTTVLVTNSKARVERLCHPFLCLPGSHAHPCQGSQIRQSSQIATPQRCFKSLHSKDKETNDKYPWSLLHFSREDNRSGGCLEQGLTLM